MKNGVNTLQNIVVRFAEHCNRHCTPTLSKDIWKTFDTSISH